MLLPPVEIFLSWPKPNYVNPVQHGSYMVPILSCMIAITTVVIGLRLYVRAFILQSFKLDDWFIIAATITAHAVTATNIISKNYGVGFHVWDVPLTKLSDVRFWSWVTQLTFTTSVALTKISILLFYLRFCTSKTFKRWIYGSMGFIVIWYFAWIFLVIFQCIPVTAYWSLQKPGDKCLSLQNEMHLLHGSTNLFSDILVLILPIPTVLRIQMPARQKASLIGVFSLGVIAPLSAILRLVYIQRATTSWDATWWCVDLWIFTSLETHVGIICTSIPALKPLVIRVFPRFGSSQHYGNSTPMGYNNSASGGNQHSTMSNENSRSRAGDRSNKARSIYPLTSIIAVDERGESQESIVGNGRHGSGSGTDITTFSSSPPPVPPKDAVIKTTEISWKVHTKKFGSERNV